MIHFKDADSCPTQHILRFVLKLLGVVELRPLGSTSAFESCPFQPGNRHLHYESDQISRTNFTSFTFFSLFGDPLQVPMFLFGRFTEIDKSVYFCPLFVHFRTLLATLNYSAMVDDSETRCSCDLKFC